MRDRVWMVILPLARAPHWEICNYCIIWSLTSPYAIWGAIPLIEGYEDVSFQEGKNFRNLEKAIEKCTLMGSGLVWYKGVGWDWRMARYALEELKARREE